MYSAEPNLKGMHLLPIYTASMNYRDVLVQSLEQHYKNVDFLTVYSARADDTAAHAKMVVDKIGLNDKTYGQFSLDYAHYWQSTFLFKNFFKYVV